MSMRGATNSVATCQLSAVRSLPHPGAPGTIGIFRRALIVQSYSSGGANVRPPPTNTRFFGPTRVGSWTASRSVQPCSHDSLLCLTAYRQTDRHADHEACNMCSNRPNLCHERLRFPPEPWVRTRPLLRSIWSNPLVDQTKLSR